MSKPVDIAELATRLVAQATSSTTKVAAAPSALSTPAAQALKIAAAALRTLGDDAEDLTVLELLKTAAARGTGAQSPAQGAGVGSAMPPPTLPSLGTTNLGVTAGTGGAPPMPKIGSALSTALREAATHFRATAEKRAQENDVQASHVLNAATTLRYLLPGVTP